MTAPLHGIRVIDLSSLIMGPWTTHILADYGAEVIKVEAPAGDIMRQAGPMRNPGMGPIFLNSNRNKRSIALDLKKPAGRAAALRLAAGADVFVHNVRPEAMARLALGPSDVAAANPRLIYVSLVGYGTRGPYANRPAYDDLIQGACGLAALFAANGDAPRYVPTTVADRISGISAANAVLAALLRRERTGAGEIVEVPMFETMAEFLLADHFGGRTFDPPIGATGYTRLLAADRRPYRTKDGYVCVLLYNDSHWERFFAAAGEEALYRAEARLHADGQRRANYDYAYGEVARILLSRTSAEWLALLAANDIPSTPLRSVDELLDDPHLAAVELIETVSHPTEGELRGLGMAARWAGWKPETPTPAPRIGEHSREILREAGFGEAEIGRMLAEGVTAEPERTASPARAAHGRAARGEA